LKLLAQKKGKSENIPLEINGIFHETTIAVDLILGFPWMWKNKLGVLPHENGLFLDEEEVRYIRSWPLKEKEIANFLVEEEEKFGEIEMDKIDTTPPLKKGKKKWVKKFSPKISDIPDSPLDSNLERPEATMSQICEFEKFRFHVSGCVGEKNEVLDHDALMEVCERLMESEKNEAHEVGVISTYSEANEWGEFQPLVNELRRKISEDYKDVVFGEEVKPNPPVRGPHCEARIFLKPGAQPKKQRTMQLMGERLEAMEAITKEWLRQGKVEPCEGPWGMPSFPVKKAHAPPTAPIHKRWRGVVDARYMNSQCMDDAYPLPRVEEPLIRQGRKRIFSTIDLVDAFHQIPLHPESRHITATYTPQGTVQWRVVVMGWKNGVQYCQRNLEATLASAREIADGYIDDILIGTDHENSDSVEELLRKHFGYPKNF
jgi:hypothetical protein